MTNLKLGDTEALGELYERYKTQLFSFFLRTSGDRMASNDLLMNTFERLYKYRKSFKEDAAFRPWCFQIANNLIKDYFKLRTKQSDINKVIISDDEATDTFLEGETRSYDDLYKALNKLKPIDKRIITQYYLLEIPYSEIANLENISVNTARIRVCRALKQLNGFMKKAQS